MTQLDYVPKACEWIHEAKSSRGRIAVSSSDSNDIIIYKAEGGCQAIQTVSLHGSPVAFMKFNQALQIVISVDINGMIEYWDSNDYDSFPAKKLKFQFKTE